MRQRVRHLVVVLGDQRDPNSSAFDGFDPERDVVGAAECTYREGRIPLSSAEGFFRQIRGRREYICGDCWHRMPRNAKMNAMGRVLATARRPDP